MSQRKNHKGSIKYLILNNNKDTIYQNLWDTTKFALKQCYRVEYVY